MAGRAESALNSHLLHVEAPAEGHPLRCGSGRGCSARWPSSRDAGSTRAETGGHGCGLRGMWRGAMRGAWRRPGRQTIFCRRGTARPVPALRFSRQSGIQAGPATASAFAGLPKGRPGTCPGPDPGVAPAATSAWPRDSPGGPRQPPARCAPRCLRSSRSTAPGSALHVQEAGASRPDPALHGDGDR
jgi:hypothetical protein